ncbi:MAG: MotA/TolQ/ExbB proton channel family protein, partial [Fibrobacter sp.]|nr:MotA/TolQ/ExbB proton channel family protein [Fibrobacter sp.]
MIESLRNTYEAGGVVMLPILVCGVIGFYFLYSAWLRIGRDYFRKDSYKVVEQLRKDLQNSESGLGITA